MLWYSRAMPWNAARLPWKAPRAPANNCPYKALPAGES